MYRVQILLKEYVTTFSKLESSAQWDIEIMELNECTLSARIYSLISVFKLRRSLCWRQLGAYGMWKVALRLRRHQRRSEPHEYTWTPQWRLRTHIKWPSGSFVSASSVALRPDSVMSPLYSSNKIGALYFQQQVTREILFCLLFWGWYIFIYKDIFPLFAIFHDPYVQ